MADKFEQLKNAPEDAGAAIRANANTLIVIDVAPTYKSVTELVSEANKKAQESGHRARTSLMIVRTTNRI